MRYGYFDEEKKEYVITRPDTPAPWVNYLGSPEYGAIVSNNAGGYSFAKSGANGRILRYIFNQFDQPGRYIYLRDNDTKDYWSASWQPVGKDLSEYKSECHHGTAYTKMMADYSEIHSEVRYYVPLGQSYEVWNLKVTNCSDRKREISVTGYAEFTNNSNYEQDQVNLQYSQYITRTVFCGDRVRQMIHANLDGLKDGEEVDNKNVFNRFFGLAGEKVSSWCGDREKFLGRYHGYNNPAGVEAGVLCNEGNYNENSCGALSTVITLEPGESREMAFLAGMKEDNEAAEIIAHYADCEKTCAVELEELISYWHGQLAHFQIRTPSPEFDTMINTWNAYNCFMTFIWSRAASFTYCGLRNGYGYRDTVQDIQGVIHLAPEMALDKIRFMLSAQVDNGGGLPLVKFDHKAGHETCPDENDENSIYAKETGHPCYRADDALWLFPTVNKYIGESGNKAFLDEVIVYANGGEDTVYEHLKRAINFSMERLGAHTMPAGLYADWNDCLRLGKKGESTFVAFQLYYAMSIIKGYALDRGDNEYAAYIDKVQPELGKSLEACWDEDRFIRGYRENGEIVGAKKDPEASMWLNPQSWSVISGFASDKQAETAMEKVHEILNTPFGVKIMEPPYVDHYFDGALMHIFNPDTKENGGIFSQTQGWAILAESLLGHGDRAFEYFLESSPANMNDKAEVRILEPYVHGQFTESTRSPYAGRSHVHWLTGTGSTVMVGCVEGICGMRPNAEGLVISPSIPHTWDGFKIEKNFRGKHLSIDIQNPDHVQSGVKSMTVNGEAVEGNFVCECKMTEQTNIVVVLG